jgi:hypothetical protein
VVWLVTSLTPTFTTWRSHAPLARGFQNSRACRFPQFPKPFTELFLAVQTLVLLMNVLPLALCATNKCLSACSNDSGHVFHARVLTTKCGSQSRRYVARDRDLVPSEEIRFATLVFVRMMQNVEDVEQNKLCFDLFGFLAMVRAPLRRALARKPAA